MIKNEIEYMHGKISGIKSQEDLADHLENKSNDNIIKEVVKDDAGATASSDTTTYSKEFSTGNIGLSIIMNNGASKKDGKTESNGKRFRIVVEHGELYLECIDKFEDIFEISQDLINPKDRAKDQKVELTDVLDPYLFENHRDIVNALFEVYFDVSEDYLKRFYDE